MVLGTSLLTCLNNSIQQAWNARVSNAANTLLEVLFNATAQEIH